MATTAPQPVDPFGDELLEYDDNGSRSSADGYRYAQYGPWIQKRRTAMNGWFAWARWLVLLAIVATLWTGFIGRWFVGGGVDVYHVVHHFTNWSWVLLQLPFYTIVWAIFTAHEIHRWWYQRRERRARELVGSGGADDDAMDDSSNRKLNNFSNMIDVDEDNDRTVPASAIGWHARIVRWMLVSTIFLAYTAVLIDAVFVYVLVFLNTDSIANLWRGHSSQVSVGDLILGNEIYHTWPILFVLLFTGLYCDILQAAYARILGGIYHALLSALLYVYILFGAPAIPILLYFAIFDPNSIYGVDGNIAIGLVILFIIICVVNIPIVYFFTPIILPAPIWRYVVARHRRMRTREERQMHRLREQTRKRASYSRDRSL